MRVRLVNKRVEVRSFVWATFFRGEYGHEITFRAILSPTFFQLEHLSFTGELIIRPGLSLPRNRIDRFN